MQKVSYMGDGTTTDFYFNFPFFMNTDIVVLKNNQTATDYTVVGTPAGLNADIPYTGGKIVFNNAPFATDSITIYRHLPLSRTVDYQPTEKINPILLNQDMNYMMEVLKDMQDKMDSFSEQYNDIVNKESTDNLLSKIHHLDQLIDNDEIINKYASNCITKIPQDIKTKLSSGTFTLKSGSKIYIPNGSGVFDTIILSADKSVTPSGFSTSSNRMIIYTPNGTIDVLDTQSTYIYSGTTTPTTFDNDGKAFWYDTTNNSIKYTNDNGSTWTGGYGFPIALVEITNGTGVTAINQTFNGIGFIGRTLYVLPGVKALHPNGRNADGTLNNNTLTTNSVLLHTGGVSDKPAQLVLRKDATACQFSTAVTDWKYDEIRNVFFNITYNDDKWLNIGTYYYDTSLGYVSQFNPKTTIHFIDYNDREYIAHQAMPSGKYTNLTLPASGNSIVATANGYFTVNKAATTSGEYINMVNNSNNTNVNSIASGAMNCRLMIPVSKNDVVTINYTVAGTTNWFRFVYANGSK